MQADLTTKLLLLLIAIALWGLLLKPLSNPPAVAAQSSQIDLRSIGGMPVRVNPRTGWLVFRGDGGMDTTVKIAH